MEGNTMPDTVLEIRDVTKYYHRFMALSGVSLSLAEGEVRALIGPNGAGKTTLFSVISGENPMSQGSIVYRGKDISRRAPWERVRMGIGRCFQVARVFLDMTIEESLYVALQAYSGWQNRFQTFQNFFTPPPYVLEKTEVILDEIGLADKRSVLVKTLSHGDKKRLELAMAMAQEPAVLLLDEPTAGMSPRETRETVNLIKEIHSHRKFTVFLTEHDMEVVFSLADNISVLSYGRLIANGKPEEIRSDQSVQEAYLGKGDEFDAVS
jgi:branched-chain amino acid transport system ATP-binding protein